MLEYSKNARVRPTYSVFCRYSFEQEKVLYWLVWYVWERLGENGVSLELHYVDNEEGGWIAWYLLHFRMVI